MHKPGKFILTFLLLISSLLFLNFTCSECEEEIHDQAQYSVNFNPLDSKFSIGDTIQLSSSINAQIELEFRNSIYDNSNQKIHYNINIFKIQDNNRDVFPAREDFEIIASNGDVHFPSSRTFELEIDNKCGDIKCAFLINLIPEEDGYYGVSLNLGRFGLEEECQILSLFPKEIVSNGNNFEICNEINTENFSLKGAFYRNPETQPTFYFFKVTD